MRKVKSPPFPLIESFFDFELQQRNILLIMELLLLLIGFTIVCYFSSVSDDLGSPDSFTFRWSSSFKFLLSSWTLLLSPPALSFTKMVDSLAPFDFVTLVVFSASATLDSSGSFFPLSSGWSCLSERSCSFLVPSSSSVVPRAEAMAAAVDG